MLAQILEEQTTEESYLVLLRVAAQKNNKEKSGGKEQFNLTSQQSEVPSQIPETPPFPKTRLTAHIGI